MASRYLWWEPVAGHVHSTPRKIAQIMHLGTYEDVRRLEALADPAMLAAIMRQSQPGWFDDKSWDFWRGRLTASGETDIPNTARRAVLLAARDAVRDLPEVAVTPGSLAGANSGGP